MMIRNFLLALMPDWFRFFNLEKNASNKFFIKLKGNFDSFT